MFLGNVFYLQPKQLLLQHSLVLLQDSFQHIVASVWKHDSELGRGYLLLSDAHGHGRLWRFERGGGPIPIGRTLAMDPSGCRTIVCTQQQQSSSGSGGLAVDFSTRNEFREGRTVIAEWGEKRIVRLEDTTGARTPLVINVPNDGCKQQQQQQQQRRRVERPIQMVYTPFGDLLFLESSSSESECNMVMRLTQAVHIPPLHSAMESRMAHKWNETHRGHPIDVLYKETEIKSMTLDSTGLGLYLTVRQAEDDSVLLVHLSLLEDDDDDDEQEDNKHFDPMGVIVKVEFNLTRANIADPPQAMAVDEKGHVFLSVPTGVLVIKNDKVLGTLSVSPTPITSLTLGEDHYLYITTSTQLLRIRVRHGPPKVPTNRVKKWKRKM
jgi:hypothetical protein